MKENRRPSRRRHGPPARAGRPAAPASLPHHLHGLHAVAAALANPRRARHRLVATANALRRLEALGARPDVAVEETTARHLSRQLGGEAVHQGCVLYCDPLPEPDVAEVLASRRLVVLDQVTDPHNVGAVLRSAAAFAVEAMIVTARHSPRESPVLAKAAAGALELVPLARAGNLARALERLAGAGIEAIGLDAGADAALPETPPAEPWALVLGAEGRGLRRNTAQGCARLARIDLPGEMASLNISNAAALALYIADRGGG